MKEIWKPIEGTNGRYEVSNTGKVRSLNYKRTGTTREMKPAPDQKGYMKTVLLFDRKYKPVKIHRLVAEAFIENPDNLPQVNHKDGNKGNNSVANLEWTSNYDNAHHAMEHGLFQNSLEAIKKSNQARRKAVVAIDEQGHRRVFESQNEASRQLNINRRHIQLALKGERMRVKGYKFIYPIKGVML